MVRRVLHMVREECQREDELRKEDQGTSPFSHAPSAAEVEREDEREEYGPGLLSKMLRQPGIPAVRALSLHNLLDHPPGSSQLQPPPLVSQTFLNIFQQYQHDVNPHLSVFMAHSPVTVRIKF